MDDQTPHSPEEQPADVREELDQFEVTHEGTREAVRDEAPSQHLGADERQVTPVTPPMRGPGNLVGPFARGDQGDTDEDDDMDPVDEITPG